MLHIYRNILALASALALSASSLSPAQAQDQNLFTPSASGVQVSPVVDDFIINAGETLERSIEINSLTNNTSSYFPIVLDFQADPDTGDPIFFNPGQRFTSYAMSSWIKFEEEQLSIGPGESRTVRYTINAPRSATPGGRYAAILFSTEKPTYDDDNNIVGVVGLIGTLALATVPGNMKESLLINEYTSPTSVFTPPADFSVTIGNNGTVHSRPKGGITIRNWSGKQVHYIPINDTNGAILPESQRSYEGSWEFGWSNIGRYTANLVLAYGANHSIAEMRTFYVIPYWLLILVGALIIGVITTLFMRRRPRREKKKQPPREPRRIVMG